MIPFQSYGKYACKSRSMSYLFIGGYTVIAGATAGGIGWWYWQEETRRNTTLTNYAKSPLSTQIQQAYKVSLLGTFYGLLGGILWPFGLAGYGYHQYYSFQHGGTYDSKSSSSTTVAVAADRLK